MSFAKATDLLRLALMASGRVGVTLDEIVDEFQCDRRTAQRMTAALQALFPATERWFGDEDRRPRWRIPSVPPVPFLAPTPDELAVLATATANLRRDGMAAEADTLALLEQKVRASVPVGSRARLAVDEEALLEALGFATRPGPRPITNPEIDEVISAALKARQCIQISYQAREEEQPRTRRVAPLGLLLGARRYLVAYDLEKNVRRPQHYRVEDIFEAGPLDRSFEPEPGFDIAAHAKKAFGSFESVEEYGEVVWRFSPAAAPRARRFLFHPDQSTEEEEDGSLLVRFHASGRLEMCWHLYSWGDGVEVLAPPELANLISGHRRTDFQSYP